MYALYIKAKTCVALTLLKNNSRTSDFETRKTSILDNKAK